MLQLVKLFPINKKSLSNDKKRLFTNSMRLAQVYSKNSGTKVLPILFRRQSRFISSNEGDSPDDKNAKPINNDDTIEDEEFNEEQLDEDTSFENENEKSIVKATVPEYYPQVIAVPVSRRPVFPGFYKTITVKDPKVASALTQALKKGRPYVGLFLAKDATEQQSTEPSKNGAVKDKDIIKNLNEINRVGVFSQIINIIPMVNDGMTAIVYPHRRILATELISHDGDSSVSQVKNENIKDEQYDKRDKTIRAISQEIFAVLADVAKLNSFFREHITHHNVPPSVFEDAAKLADFVAVLSSGDSVELQSLLEETKIEERLRKALILLKKELVTAQLQHSISKEVEQKLTQKQREYFLHEQLKTIKKELGLETDSKEKLIQMFTERISAKASVPENIKKVFDEEMGKLAVLEPSGAEFNVTRNYLDWITQMPWGKNSSENLNVNNASKVLNEDHYGLDDVKERILEFIAVGKLKGCVSGKILCLVGPPGVGKTSIGKSIARALGREYFRFSVGGLTDVSEIKGHRRTYVGAMPGKLVQALKKVQTENPLILIDEIDKLGKGHQGDPASALLELLDPEQNNSFLDHYLDVPLDLSKVLFMCTANQSDTIPAPLLDRMEVINLSGYVAQEKMEISKKYLIPQARDSSGVNESQVKVEDSAIESLIKHYCRESGVRNLKKQIEKIYRKSAFKIVKEEAEVNPADNSSQLKTLATCPIVINQDNLKEFCGNPVFTSDRLYEGELLPMGVVTGLAWTSMGGSILYIETILEKSISDDHLASSSSKGQNQPGLIRTGQLGDVMKESSSIAYSFAKSFMVEHFPLNKYFDHASLHLHVPEGATPKDGPSAGCTMATSLLSQALCKSIRSDIAMTGELTLTGKVLRIGGVKEKTIAAKRAGITNLIFPKSNESDWMELPSYIKEGLVVHFVDSYLEIAKIVGLVQ